MPPQTYRTWLRKQVWKSGLSYELWFREQSELAKTLPGNAPDVVVRLFERVVVRANAFHLKPRLMVGACVMNGGRGFSSRSRRLAHAHNYSKGPYFGWICFRDLHHALNGDTMAHEVAHLIAPDQGHTPKWRETFRTLNGKVPVDYEKKRSFYYRTFYCWMDETGETRRVVLEPNSGDLAIWFFRGARIQMLKDRLGTLGIPSQFGTKTTLESYVLKCAILLSRKEYHRRLRLGLSMDDAVAMPGKWTTQHFAAGGDIEFMEP